MRTQSVLLLLSGLAAANPQLTVTGPGTPGTILTFTMTGANPDYHAYYAWGPVLAKSNFGFMTLDLGYPMIASGMGPISDEGVASKRLAVPADLDPGLYFVFYAQAVALRNTGGGNYVAEVSNYAPFVVQS
jgi:hypothetical protein